MSAKTSVITTKQMPADEPELAPLQHQQQQREPTTSAAADGPALSPDVDAARGDADVGAGVPVGCCGGSKWLAKLDGEIPTNNVLFTLTSNRWSRCAVYMVVSVCCCALYFGWQQFQKVLFSGGVYGWLCTEKDPGWSYAKDGACDAQNAKVQMLYTVASAMEYVVGVFAGVLLDHLGPRSCGMIGMAALGVGVALLLVCSEGFQLHVVAMALMGGAVNLVGFPTLLAADFFPGHETGVITFFITCQIGASLVGVVFLALVRSGVSMHGVFSGYLLFVWLPLFALFSLALPCRRRKTTATTAAGEIADVEKGCGGTELSSSEVAAQQQQPNLKKRRDSNASGEPSQLSADQQKGTKVIRGNWTDFGKQLLTPEIELFAVYYVLQLLQFVYYPTTTLQMYGEWMSDFAGYIMPSQALFGLIFGYLVDRVTTLPLCWLMNTMNLATFALMLTGSEKLQYLTVVINCVSQSFIYTSKYTYVTEIYAPNNFGKLAGYIGFLGGVFTFVNIPISASSNYKFWSVFYLCVSVVLYFMLAYLTLRYRRGIRYVKVDEDNAAVAVPSLEAGRIDTEEINKAS